MDRAITGYEQDAESDWVAVLDCGHRQHVRHNPPLANRPWVLSRAGREAKLGCRLECLPCRRFELPSHFQRYRGTPVFSETTVPQALRRDHSTRTGVWARLCVLEGRLHYAIDAWSSEFNLSPDRPGIVVPEVQHHVTPIGPVRFLVEFYAAPG